MTFEHAVEIAASAGRLFDLTQDYHRRLLWDPFLRSATLMNGAVRAGEGVRARCVSHRGWAMETEYVSFHPPRVSAIKMTRGPWIVRTFAGSWRFEPMGVQQTRVIFTYSLTTRPRLLSWLLTPLIGRLFAREMRQRLTGLQQFVEVTNPIS